MRHLHTSVVPFIANCFIDDKCDKKNTCAAIGGANFKKVTTRGGNLAVVVTPRAAAAAGVESNKAIPLNELLIATDIGTRGITDSDSFVFLLNLVSFSKIAATHCFCILSESDGASSDVKTGDLIYWFDINEQCLLIKRTVGVVIVFKCEFSANL